MNYYDTYFDGIEHLITTFEAALPDDTRQAFTNELREWERKHSETI